MDSTAVTEPSRITPEVIKKICRDRDDLYDTVALNEKMFLQYGGYSAMENLESLSGVRSLWLDYNCFTRVENLAPLTQLTTLYLSNNNLSSLAGISTLPSLILLDASRNALTAVAPGDLRGLKLLKTLDLSANRLTDISGVVDATALTTLNLADNFLPSAPATFAALGALPALRSLTLKGNESVTTDNAIRLCTNASGAHAAAAALAVELGSADLSAGGSPTAEMTAALAPASVADALCVEANYRRASVALLRGLVYLDDRPVSKDERRIVSAWLRGGGAAEVAERQRIAAEEKAAHDRGMSRWAQMRRRAQGLPEEEAEPEPEPGESTTAMPKTTLKQQQRQKISALGGGNDGGAKIEIVEDSDDEEDVAAVLEQPSQAVTASVADAAEDDEEDADLEAITNRNIFTLRPSAAANAAAAAAGASASAGATAAYSVLSEEEASRYRASARPYTQTMLGLELGGHRRSNSAPPSDDDDDEFAAGPVAAVPAAPVPAASVPVAALSDAEIISAVEAAFFRFDVAARKLNARATSVGAAAWTEASVRTRYAAAVK